MRFRHSIAQLGIAVATMLIWSGLAALNASPALHIVSYSGSATPGGTITIAGSGFGTKPSAAPLKWDNFDAGTNGSSVPNWATDTAGPISHPLLLSNTVTRRNSTLSVRSDFTGGQWNSSLAVTGQTFTKVYLDAWVYMDEAPPYSRNNKMFRLFTGATGTPNLYYNLYCNPSSSHLDQDGLSGGLYNEWIGIGTGSFARQWMHLQAYFEESHVSVDDGTARLWINGVQYISDVGNFRTRNTDTHWNSLYIGNYFAHESDSSCDPYGDAYAYWDNVYVDTTQARVEIGDSPVYVNSAHREIQVPTAWSDTSITLSMNQGSFATMTGLYLFVVDASGNVSPGYQVGGAFGAAPAAPMNLRIIP